MVAALLLTLQACSSSGALDTSGLDELPPEEDEGEDVEPRDTFPDNAINEAGITVTGVEPGSGPFAGGNQAIVRGSGFTEDALVFVDGRMVQPANTILRDSNSLIIVVPAGEVGLADVTVRIGEDEVGRQDAYTYNPLVLEPLSGSIAGGTSVSVTVDGAQFDDGVVVEFGDAACTQLRVISPNTVRCLTPRGDVGEVDVAAYWPEEPERPRLVALDAFEYIDLIDTDAGGLNGGPIEGTLNLTVIDSFANRAIPEALVVIGDDPAGELQGRTDSRGQITFSNDELAGPLTVHVVGDCLEKTSIVLFDAQNATIHVTPSLDPSCGMPGDPPPPGRGTAGALISGELIYPGSDEFAINAWDNIPKPRANEERVAYVFTTRVRTNVRNPNPGLSGLQAKIIESEAEIGRRGYPYQIFARPAGLAVYAIAGLERIDTREFAPYVMGVRRDIVTAPGDETLEADIIMDIPLDREIAVQMQNLPGPVTRGPDQFRVQAHIDLGGEGVIYRAINGWPLDVQTGFTAGSLFRFFAQPALVGSLSDGRYRIVAGWYTGDGEAGEPPLTEMRLEGVEQQLEPVVVDDLLAIPRQLAPAEGAPLPADRVLRWELDGEPPDLYEVIIIGGDNLPAWRLIVPGTETSAPIPDFSGAEDVLDIAPGVILWAVRAIRIDDFDYHQLKFNQIDSSRFWSHTSMDAFTTQR
jgi:hypothetical protein